VQQAWRAVQPTQAQPPSDCPPEPLSGPPEELLEAPLEDEEAPLEEDDAPLDDEDAPLDDPLPDPLPPPELELLPGLQGSRHASAMHRSSASPSPLSLDE
jgi:hypothetical protein